MCVVTSGDHTCGGRDLGGYLIGEGGHDVCDLWQAMLRELFVIKTRVREREREREIIGTSLRLVEKLDLFSLKMPFCLAL